MMFLLSALWYMAAFSSAGLTSQSAGSSCLVAVFQTGNDCAYNGAVLWKVPINRNSVINLPQNELAEFKCLAIGWHKNNICLMH
jgi:hypothetical protein